MRARLLIVAFGASGFCDASAAPIEHADGQSVHRCIGEHGEITFSGLPCSGASAAPNNANDASADATTATGSPRAATGAVCPATLDALRDAITAAFARRDANAIAGIVRWDGVGGGAARERMRDLAAMTASPLLGIDMQSDAPPVSRAENDTERDRSSRDDGMRDGEDDVRPSSIDARDDAERGASPTRSRAATLAPGTVDIRTGGELGARDNEFRIVPAGGCYWLDW
jgi:hypothetical protein